MFEALNIFHTSGSNEWHSIYPRKRRGPESEVSNTVREDIRVANILAKRIDANGNPLTDVVNGRVVPRQPLTRKELREGAKRHDPRTDEERHRDQRRREQVINPPAPELTTEEQRNAALKAKRAEIEFNNLPLLDRQIIESDRRIEEQKREAARQTIRDSAEYRHATEQLEALEYFAKFDVELNPIVLEEVRHIRDVLEKTLDVKAATENLKQVQQLALGQREASNLQLKASIDIAQRATDAWKSSDWDRPHVVRMHGGVETFTLHYKGQTAHVSRGLMEGQTDEQLIRAYFPEVQS